MEVRCTRDLWRGILAGGAGILAKVTPDNMCILLRNAIRS